MKKSLSIIALFLLIGSLQILAASHESVNDNSSLKKSIEFSELQKSISKLIKRG